MPDLVDGLDDFSIPARFRRDLPVSRREITMARVGEADAREPPADRVIGDRLVLAHGTKAPCQHAAAQ